MTSWQDLALTLGKDHYRDRFWYAELPCSWTIKPSQKTDGWHRLGSYPGTYTHNDIQFRFNNLGWRSDFDFSQQLQNGSNIIVLGCSDTFGPGLPADSTWPILLQNLVGPTQRVLNFSWCGISTDWIARIGHKSMRYLEKSVAAVCVLWPHLSAREFISKRACSGINTYLKSVVPFAQWWDYIDWKSNNYNFYKNYHLLKSTANSIGANFFDLTINRQDKSVPWDIVRRHEYESLGTLSHIAIADYFYRKIQGRPSFWQEHRSRSLCDKT